MSKVQPVPREYVHATWPLVEKYVSSAMAYSAGEYTAEQLKGMLAHGMQQMVVVVDDDGTIRGAATVEFVNFPQMRVAFVTSIGGRMISSKDNWDQFAAWMKSMGATHCRGAAREEIARLWKQKFGFEEVYRIVEKEL